MRRIRWKIYKLLQVKEENHLICGIERQLHHWGGVQHQVLRSLTINELAYLQRFGRRQVGYANGLKDIGAVNYKKVCTGQTNFVEALQVSYEPSQVSLSDP